MDKAPTKFRKKPVVIEAMQFDGTVESAERLCSWANKVPDGGHSRLSARQADGSLGEPIVDYVTTDGIKATDVFVHTLEGDMFISPSDWLIQGVAGEFYPCKPNIFEATYDPA